MATTFDGLIIPCLLHQHMFTSAAFTLYFSHISVYNEVYATDSDSLVSSAHAYMLEEKAPL
uniref:Uncharacterized protein n=1 Tax=Thermosporothrix sp. COM3 TaxID=2490863 RepID=A0A455SN06_9CHLR|nr:hypothetical protein KTC_23460 [Thermosporothrix sp. COM3]